MQGQDVEEDLYTWVFYQLISLDFLLDCSKRHWASSKIFWEFLYHFLKELNEDGCPSHGSNSFRMIAGT